MARNGQIAIRFQDALQDYTFLVAHHLDVCFCGSPNNTRAFSRLMMLFLLRDRICRVSSAVLSRWYFLTIRETDLVDIPVSSAISL